MTRTFSAAALIGTLAFASAPAFAHVSLPAGGAHVGTTYDAAFRVGHACEKANSTTAITVTLPKEFQFKEAVARQGWKLEAPAANAQGGTVRWTAESAANALSGKDKAAFVVRGVLPKTAQVLYFPVQQACDVGRVDWNQIPSAKDAHAKLESPAARLDVLPENVATVDVRDAWVRAAVKGQSGTGAFMTLTDPQGGKLVSVSSPAAGVVEIHEMKMEGDVMRMRPIDGLALPAGEKVSLSPGGFHLMMMDLKQPITAGAKLPFKLTFEDASGKRRDREIEAEVRTGAANAGAAGGHGSHGGHQH